MGADLTKTGQTEVGNHQVRLLPDPNEHQRAVVSLPIALLDLLVQCPAACVASQTVKTLLQQELAVRERSRLFGGKVEVSGLSNNLTKDQYQLLHMMKQAFKLSGEQSEILMSCLLSFKENTDEEKSPRYQEEPRIKDKSFERGQKSTSSPSKQFKKVNFQTYEYLSKDIIRDKSPDEDSVDSGSLGEDTEENVKNMNLDWNINRNAKKNHNIGATLKDLITQNSMISAINIGSSQSKQPDRFAIKDKDYKEKENKYVDQVIPREDPLKKKNSSRGTGNSNPQQGYIPRSYSGIYIAKKEVGQQRYQGELEIHTDRVKDSLNSQEPRAGSGILNHHVKPNFDSISGALHNFTSFRPNSLSINPGLKVEKRLTFTDFE
jgi:hypothetical protein